MNVEDRGAPVFVWGAWAALVAGSAALLAAFGRNVPYLDDWDLIPVLAGHERADLAWYWSQLNEHRVVLPRLVLLGLYRITGNDFRAGMAADVAILAAAAAGAILAARKVRGRTAYADAFLPLVLAGLSHYANLLWGWQVTLVLPVAMVLAILFLLIGEDRPGLGRVLAAGLLVAALPLGGATGLIFVPPLAAWLGFWGWSERARIRGSLAAGVGLAGLATLSVLAYRHGFVRPDHLPRLATTAEAVRGTFQFLALAFGIPGTRLWPWSSAPAALLAVTAIGRLLVLARRPESRPRALLLLAFLVGSLGLAAGVAVGRAGGGEFAVFEARYVTLVAPLLVVGYFAWIVDPPARVAELVPTTLLALALATLWPNAQTAVAFGQHYAEGMDAFRRDVDEGVPPYAVIRRHTPFVNFSQDSLRRYLPMAREAKIAGLGRLAPEPETRVEPVPLTPARVVAATWAEDGTVRVEGDGSLVAFLLPEPVFVAGIRIRYDHENATGSAARFQTFWKDGDSLAFPAVAGYANWALPTGEGKETVVWVGETVRAIAFRVDDRPATFRFGSVELLVPVQRASGSGTSPADRSGR